MQIKPPRPLVLWRFTDGKPGHEKQTLGLCNALGRETPAAMHDIPVRPGVKNLAYWAAGYCPYGQGLPPPDLLIGAGHATHLPMLAARRAKGGRTVVLMGPSLPLGLFDLCLIPEHDAPPVRGNVVPTLGAINNVTPGNEHDPGLGLILVGGPSAHFVWDTEDIYRQIRSLAQSRSDVRWMLTTSRRTPETFLAGLGAEGVQRFPADATPTGWLEDRLARAGEVWVTPDSVSMVYEALTAGCRVGLLGLQPVKGSRVANSILGLESKGMVTCFGTNRPPYLPSATAPSIDEARRCARVILEKWFP